MISMIKNQHLSLR